MNNVKLITKVLLLNMFVETHCSELDDWFDFIRIVICSVGEEMTDGRAIAALVKY